MEIRSTKESRDIYGVDLQFVRDMSWGNALLSLKVLGGLRHENVVNNELSYTYQRKNTLETVALGDVDESNIYGGSTWL